MCFLLLHFSLLRENAWNGMKKGQVFLSPTNLDLADIWGRTDIEFENYYFLFLGPIFPHVQTGPGPPVSPWPSVDICGILSNPCNLAARHYPWLGFDCDPKEAQVLHIVWPRKGTDTQTRWVFTRHGTETYWHRTDWFWHGTIFSYFETILIVNLNSITIIDNMHVYVVFCVSR